MYLMYSIPVLFLIPLEIVRLNGSNHRHPVLSVEDKKKISYLIKNILLTTCPQQCTLDYMKKLVEVIANYSHHTERAEARCEKNYLGIFAPCY